MNYSQVHYAFIHVYPIYIYIYPTHIFIHPPYLLIAPVVEEDDEWYTEDSNKPTDVSTDIKPTTTNSIQEEELIPEATTLSSAEHASEQ